MSDKQQYVTLDGLEINGGAEDGKFYAFPCAVLGERWNGFATPGFTKAQADLLIRIWNEVDTAYEARRRPDNVSEPMGQAEYVADGDLYRFILNAEATDPEERYLDFCNNGDGFYHIGAWYWTWSDTKPDAPDAECFHFLTLEPSSPKS